MTAPAKRTSTRLSALPDPEIVSLIDDPLGPYASSPDGWWTEYGGALDVKSGVVHLPASADPPPCPFPCELCARRQGA
jgi:hypothetical protein